MRVGRCALATRAQAPFLPLSPTSPFVRNMEAHPLASDQTYARKIGNQLNYGNTNYVSKEGFNGGTAPSFYGYDHYGYNGLPYGNATYAAPMLQAIFVVPAGQPTVHLTLVNTLFEPVPSTEYNELHKAFEAVPLPTLSKVPSGTLQGEGSDGRCIIIQPSTGKMWELWRLYQHEGVWTVQGGGLIAPGSEWGFDGTFPEWNGIYSPVPTRHNEVYGPGAAGISEFAGTITCQDVVEVLRGGPIRHALQVAIAILPASHVPPATQHDGGVPRTDTYHFLPGGEVPNGAFGSTDAAPEGSWLTFPAAAHPSDFGITGKMAKAVFEAIRTYGMCVTNRAGGGCIFSMESAAALGSPYSYAKINPFAGYTYGKYGPGGYTWGSGATAISEFIPPSWIDPTLPAYTEKNNLTESFIAVQPWKELQLLEPFAS